MIDLEVSFPNDRVKDIEIVSYQRDRDLHEEVIIPSVLRIPSNKRLNYF